MNENTDFYTEKFHSIQALRGIAALFVVLEHVRFLNCGAFGVDIFFCISGFMILFSTQKTSAHFLAKRLLRILPLYWLMTFGTYGMLLLFPALFHQTKAEPSFLLKSLFFLPFDIGGGTIQPLLRIGWTINCEIFFYLLFFLALHISHRYRGLLCSAMLLCLVALASLFPGISVFLDFYGNPVMLDFILGMAAHGICRQLYRLHAQKQLPTVCMPVAAVTAFLTFLALLLTKQNIHAVGYRRPLFWGLPAMLLVLCFFAMGLFTMLPSALVRLGNISFSLYLLHYFIITFFDRRVFDFSSPSSNAFLGVAVGIALSILAAIVAYELIEKRLTGWLRKKLLKKA